MSNNVLTRSQLEYLKENLPPSIAAVGFGIVAIIAVFYGDVPNGWLIGWAICAVLALLFRSWVYVYLKRTTDDPSDMPLAKKLITLSATATGLSWGLASIIFAMHTDDVMHWVFLAFFMSGYASGAVFSTSALLPACAGYFFPTITPITIWFFLQSEPHSQWMGALLAIFTFAAWKMAKNAHSFLIDKVEKQVQLHEAGLELESSIAKTHALQTMAGGIAHDFNNLFTGIVSGLYLLEKKNSSIAGDRHFSMIQSNVEKAAQLSTKMLDYSRSSIFTRVQINLGHLVRERVAIMSGMNIELQSSEKNLIVTGDKRQLEQVIDALLFNASESYTEGDGKVVVTLSCISSTDPETSQDAVASKGGHIVKVEVRDFGCGMTEEVLGKVYEPFFSTKFTGRGLGMSVVFGVIKRMGGEIKIESEENKGSAITLYFPTPVPDNSQP